MFIQNSFTFDENRLLLNSNNILYLKTLKLLLCIYKQILPFVCDEDTTNKIKTQMDVNIFEWDYVLFKIADDSKPILCVLVSRAQSWRLVSWGDTSFTSGSAVFGPRDPPTLHITVPQTMTISILDLAAPLKWLLRFWDASGMFKLSIGISKINRCILVLPVECWAYIQLTIRRK